MSSFWSFLDSNSDALISIDEFRERTKIMDIDTNGETSSLEFEAFFSLNSHLVCRPYRYITFRRLTDRLRSLRKAIDSQMLALFNMFD